MEVLDTNNTTLGPDVGRESRSPSKNIYFSLSPKVELRSSAIAGMGLFAKELIKAGEIIWADDTYPHTKHVVDVDTLNTWPEDKRDWYLHWAYQIDFDKYCGPLTDEEVAADASVFQNHSCDPTSWFDGDFVMTARRDIRPDEEITFDYAMTETYLEWSTFECGCGSTECRKVITGNDYLRIDVQKKYDGHFISYIQQRINKLRYVSGHYQ